MYVSVVYTIHTQLISTWPNSANAKIERTKSGVHVVSAILLIFQPAPSVHAGIFEQLVVCFSKKHQF